MSGSGGRTRVGILGFGSVGQYLTHAILHDEQVGKHFELAFVWNRTSEKLKQTEYVPKDKILEDIELAQNFSPDLVVEICHPSVVQEYGGRIVQYADLFIGSPTALADPETERTIHEEAKKENGRGVYIPSGALWGAADIQKMAQRGTLKGLTVTMKKHPTSLKLTGELKTQLDEILQKQTPGTHTLYEGPVRSLCPLAPNNVNTMAAASIAAENLGFDSTTARLMCDFSMMEHIVEIHVKGPSSDDSNQFSVQTTRVNPAQAGAVTGSATYGSFLSSLQRSRQLGNGIHMV
eukprot:gb/GECG01002543.1/.p1 GENE.gb/GECG01002543.1/~~gb/GECG01002543.1/.p1  ORF type:complete len:292 (+),score=34.02 gb/GECG01002543.1/:1-876(+)